MCYVWQVTAPSKSRRLLKRAAIASAWNSDPEASAAAIGRAANCSRKLAQKWKPDVAGDIDLTDAPRSGRKRKLDATSLQSAKQLAADPAVHGSKRVARALQEQVGGSIGASTVRRNFRSADMVYAHTKVETAMTAKHKAARVAWAQKMLDDKFDWTGVLMTDSKIFPLHLTVGKRGRKCWQDKKARVTEERSRASAAVHQYAALSAHANTLLKSVTCAAGHKNSTYTDRKTGLYLKGVGAEEYCKDVLPWFEKEGDRIFGKFGEWGGAWKFMQDGAPPHTAKATKAKLKKIFGAGRLLDWPANSPDLSPVENFWALVDRDLDAKRAHISTLQQLETELNSICRKFKMSTLKHVQRHAWQVEKGDQVRWRENQKVTMQVCWLAKGRVR